MLQTPNLAHYSSYAESALVPTANLMLNYILKPVRHQSFFKKYAGKRFLKVRLAYVVRDGETQCSVGQPLCPRVGFGEMAGVGASFFA